MRLPFPDPMIPIDSRAEVLLGYLDYFRSCVLDRVDGLPESELRSSRLPSGWTPLALVNHLAFVELRWLEWGFEGHDVAEPWGDRDDDDRFRVAEGRSTGDVVATLVERGARTAEIVRRHDLAERGRPGERWDGQEPATLERVLLHLVQEYARHVGQLDVVSELAGGPTGE